MPKRRRKPRLKVGLPVLVIGMAMIAFAYVNVSGSPQNGRPPQCFPATCPSLGYYAILGLAGFFVAMWGGIETAFAVLIRPGYLEYQPGPLVAPQPGSGPEDENILAMARELQRRVKRPKLGEISGIAWSEVQPWYRIGWKWKPRKPFVILLSSDLRGRLDGDEWKTLLTYYFLSLKIRLRLALRFFGLPFGAFLLIPIGGFLVASEYGIQGGRFYGQFVAAPAAIIILVLMLADIKGLTLRQDRYVAGLLVQRLLLDVFRKIDSLVLPRVENAKKRHGWTQRLWPVPNITERIQNLTDN